MDSHHNELHHLDHIRALPDVYVRNSLITSSYIFSLFLLLQTSLLLLNMQKDCVLNSDLLESNLKGYFYFFSPFITNILYLPNSVFILSGFLVSPLLNKSILNKLNTIFSKRGIQTPSFAVHLPAMYFIFQL